MSNILDKWAADLPPIITDFIDEGMGLAIEECVTKRNKRPFLNIRVRGESAGSGLSIYARTRDSLYYIAHCPGGHKSLLEAEKEYIRENYGKYFRDGD